MRTIKVEQSICSKLEGQFKSSSAAQARHVVIRPFEGHLV